MACIMFRKGSFFRGMIRVVFEQRVGVLLAMIDGILYEGGFEYMGGCGLVCIKQNVVRVYILFQWVQYFYCKFSFSC